MRWVNNRGRDRWLNKYGDWHSWFAWFPVLLDEHKPTGRFRAFRVWLERVERRGVRIGRSRSWEYRQ